MNNCIIDESGNQRWHDDHNKLHRDDDLPALIGRNNDGKSWYFHGKLHRTFGVVVEGSHYKSAWRWLGKPIEDIM